MGRRMQWTCDRKACTSSSLELVEGQKPQGWYTIRVGEKELCLCESCYVAFTGWLTS
jgi:hypothetical protein